MQPWAREFYLSTVWRSCRAAYVKKAGGLCERCLKRGLYVPGEIVHHRVHLTPENIEDPRITCGFDNLELLCRNCHADEHQRAERRYTIDRSGRVLTLPPVGAAGARAK